MTLALKTKDTAKPRVTHPARKRAVRLGLKANHERISKKFPRILAELAK